jgi:lysophospholipase L1-like esterase
VSATRRSRFFSLLAKLAVSVVLTILLFAAIEFAAGFLLLPRESISADSASEDDSVSATLAWLWINPAPLREDPDFLWRNQPLAKRKQSINPQPLGTEAEWTIENNSSGFRGPEVRSDPSAKNMYRVLCIGDSVTFGFNADQGDSYPAQLDRVLRAKWPDKDIEIINAGVPGWTWLQGVRFLEREGLALEPDLVIMSHGVNDQLMRALVTDAERLTQADEPLVRSIAKLRSLVADTNISYLIEQQIDTRPPPKEPSPSCERQIGDRRWCKRVGLEEIEAAVARAGQLTESNGIDLLVLNLDFTKTPAASAAQKAADAAGITFIDPVHQMDVLREHAQQLRNDELGLMPAGDRASQPQQGEYVRKRHVLFRVQTPDSAASYSVRGQPVYSSVDFEFNTRLNDEGRNGDEKPDDGVFSGTLTIPPGIPAINFRFYRGEDPEFRSIPPLESTFGDRIVKADDRLTTPVYRFAEHFMMAERTHPNSDGYAMIAETVAFEIGELPSF